MHIQLFHYSHDAPKQSPPHVRNTAFTSGVGRVCVIPLTRPPSLLELRFETIAGDRMLKGNQGPRLEKDHWDGVRGYTIEMIGTRMWLRLLRSAIDIGKGGYSLFVLRECWDRYGLRVCPKSYFPGRVVSSTESQTR